MIGGTVRLRFALAGVAVSTAFLAACSSGTSCGFGCPPVTTPTPVPAVSLAGTETQAFTYHYGFPSPQPPSTITTTIAQTVTVTPTSLASPFPAGAANDVNVAEKDTIDGLQTISLTGDSYEATSGNNVLLYGSVENTPATSNGQSTVDTLVYGAAQIVDQSSANNGASWTNKPGSQFTEVYGDGHSENRTIANDGTYKETGYAQAPDGSGYVPVTLVETSTGAGSYDGPFFGRPNINNNFYAPTGTPPTITAFLQIQGQKKIKIFTIPAWFSSNPTFYTEQDSISTSPVVPSGCAGAGAGFGTFHEVRHRVSRLDTIIGYTEQSETDTFENGSTVFCIVYSDTLKNWYDWNHDNVSNTIPAGTGKVLSQVVTGELLTTASSGSVGASAKSRFARVAPGGAGIPIAAIGALQERFNAKIEATKRELFHKKGGAR
jgi:hypothetical protein